MTIGNALETSSDEDDEDYLDHEGGGGYEDMSDEDLDIDDDFDEDGNYIGDPELAEAERLAAVADDLVTEDDEEDEDENENENEGSRPSSGYTLAIDRKALHRYY